RWVILAVFSLLVYSFQCASAWNECSISAADGWFRESHNLPLTMFFEYDRRYVCEFYQGALDAATYAFRSPCTARTFTTPEIRECLKGRRMVFLEDSLAVQQADSLVSMLKWHPGFLRKDDPRSQKFIVDEEGNKSYALRECWRQRKNLVQGSERCYDLYESTVPQGVLPSPSQPVSVSTVFITPHRASHAERPSFERSITRCHVRQKNTGYTDRASHVHRHPGYKPFRSSNKTESIVRTSKQHGRRELEGLEVELDVDIQLAREGAEGENIKQGDGISVHLRMFPRPQGENWLARAAADYNETRSSDVFVVNFGAHYHETEDNEREFKEDMGNILLDMGKMSEVATMVWREISPTHFPAPNGSYDLMDPEAHHECCTGTPPRRLDRNVWVDDFMRQNGLQDKVKVLQIYDMSLPRAAAHRTCHNETDGLLPGTMLFCPDRSKKKMDCRHWSEPGVVEEWNRLLLNHICPV
ncbi:unnamed protein product, partial [Ascophyllum nodosum]